MQIVRVVKTAFGCCLAVIIASALGLQNSTAAGIITLLSIQNTKKETLSVALKRVAAFFVAMLLAWLSFHIIGYNIPAFGVYLLFFVAICLRFQWQDAIAVCSVLITHFWVQQDMSPAFMLNETLLIFIGAGIGVILNLFMTRQIQAIREEQQKIEQQMRRILNLVAGVILQQEQSDAFEREFDTLKGTLSSAAEKAKNIINNTLASDTRYYLQYVNLRKSQSLILQHLRKSAENLTQQVEQSREVADFFKIVSISLHEYNNAAALLEGIDKLKEYFRRSPLPKDREEFETRAALFQILNDIENFLILKKGFADALTQEQKAEFWNQPKS